MTLKVYILDNDVQYATLLKGICQAVGLDVAIVNSATEFVKRLPQSGILLLDLKRPSGEGFDVIHALTKSTSQLKLILMSGYDTGVLNSGTHLAIANNIPVLQSFNKPVLVPPLLKAIRRGMDLSDLQAVAGDELRLNGDDLIPIF